MTYELSKGAIEKILKGELVRNPVLQILGYKKVPGNNRNNRYRLLVSDGKCISSFFLLAAKLGGLVSSRNLEKFTIVQVTSYVCTRVTPEKMIIVLLGLEIIYPATEVGEQIGNPVPKEGTAVSGSPDSSGMQSTSFALDSTPRLEQQVAVPVPASPIVLPISSVTPYQNKWTIRARVTHKTPMRQYSNSRGEGKFFYTDFLDESGEIRATAFNQCADRFYDLIEVNKVYYISKARLKHAKKQFTSIKNDYEMCFEDNTTVVPCEGNFDLIPSLQFNFIPIDMVYQVDKDSAVDIVGVCRSSEDVETILSRNNSREFRKRNIVLVDRSNSEISLALWDDSAENFDGSLNPVLALKGAKITDFKFRSLSALSSTAVHINPDIPEARALREWFDTEGRYVETKSITHAMSFNLGNSQWKTLGEAKDEMQGMIWEPNYYKAKACVVIVQRENCMYMSCPTDFCLKKIKGLNNGKYECVKCGQEYDSFQWRFLLNISVADFSESQWVTCFTETAELLLHKTAQELQVLRECDEDAFDKVFSEISFEPYIFELRTKFEMFNEENRLKTTVISASPVDPVNYSQKLLNDIKQMEQEL